MGSVNSNQREKGKSLPVDAVTRVTPTAAAPHAASNTLGATPGYGDLRADDINASTRPPALLQEKGTHQPNQDRK